MSSALQMKVLGPRDVKKLAEVTYLISEGGSIQTQVIFPV